MISAEAGRPVGWGGTEEGAAGGGAARSSTPDSQLQDCGRTAPTRRFGWALSMSTSPSAWRACSWPQTFLSVRKFTKRMHDMKTTGSLQRKGVKKSLAHDCSLCPACCQAIGATTVLTSVRACGMRCC